MIAFFVRARVPWLVLVTLLTVGFGLRAAGVGIERDNESLNARAPAESAAYDAFRAAFGNDEDLLLAVRPPRLLDPAGLVAVDRVTRAVAAMDGVRRVWSLTTAEEIVRGDAGAEPRALVTPPLDRAAASLGTTLDRNPDFTGWLVSADRTTAGLVIELEDRPADATYRARIIDAVRALMPVEQAAGVELHLTGVPVQKYDVATYVDRDRRVLLPLAVVVLAATLAGFFRTVAGVVVPLAVAGVTVVWTLGAYGLAGLQLNAITALLPPVLLVVALAASVHVYESWRAGHGGASGDGPGRAVAAARAIAVPAALCAVTTVQGFFSLVTSEIPAVQQFGVFAALGTAAAFVVGLTAAPAALSWLRPPPAAQAGRSWTLDLLDVTSRTATTWPVTVLGVFFGVTVLAGAAIPWVRANTDLVGFLREDAPLRRDTAFVDEHLAGTLPLDFVLARRDGAPIRSLDAYRRLEAVEGALHARVGVTTVTSVTAVLRQVARAESGDGGLALPRDERRLGDALDLLEESGHDLVRRFAAPELRALRVSVRVRSMGTAESAPLVAAMVGDATGLLGSDYTFTPTGALYHVIHDSTRLVRQQVSSFGMAMVLVVAAIGLLFRSVAFTILAIVPNVMPIIWTGGLMGVAGIELSTGTAMIASAVLGLVVDDTIYYLSHYRRVYAGDARAAVHETTRAVGTPVTAASVSLILGFWVGAFGSFKPTIYFSLLSGLTMITGVVCDLLVLPAGLVLLERLRRLDLTNGLR